MINIATLRRLIKNILKNDALFQSQILTLLNKPLNFYLGTNEDRAEEILPAIVFLTEVAEDPEGDNFTYRILFNVQILGDQNPALIDDDLEFTYEEKIAEVVVLALPVLKRKMCSIEINGMKDFYVSDSSMAIVPITDSMYHGEELVEVAIGYQASVELVIAREKFLIN